MPKTRAQLAEAMREKTLVRLSRRFESASIRGYVLDIGAKFFLLALVGDRIWLDGFECFRIEDIKNIRTDPYAAFVEAALEKRRQKIPKQPKIRIGSVGQILVSASRLFPLVTIHEEVADPHVCWIGRIAKVENGRVSMLSVRPDATWETSPTWYRLSEITRIGFGADYEDALYRVSGDPRKRRRTSKTVRA